MIYAKRPQAVIMSRAKAVEIIKTDTSFGFAWTDETQGLSSPWKYLFLTLILVVIVGLRFRTHIEVFHLIRYFCNFLLVFFIIITHHHKCYFRIVWFQLSLMILLGAFHAVRCKHSIIDWYLANSTNRQVNIKTCL